MKFGLTLPSFTWPGLDYQTTRRITKEMARRAEELGFDSLTVWDHLLDGENHPTLFPLSRESVAPGSSAAGAWRVSNGHRPITSRCWAGGMHHAGAEDASRLIGAIAHAGAAGVAGIAKICYTSGIAHDASAYGEEN
jgi:hypothetical protein